MLLNTIDGHLVLRLVGAGDHLLPAPNGLYLSLKKCYQAMLCYADCSLPCVGTSSCFYTSINVSKGILCYVKRICDELLMTELAMVEDSVVG